MNWSQQWKNVFQSPKSTIVALCSLGIAVTLAIMAVPPKASAAVITIAVLRALVGVTQQDADQGALPPSEPAAK